MKSKGEPLLQELFYKMRSHMLRPKTVVVYIREPFAVQAGGTRITLDRDIRTGLSAARFLDENLPLFNTFDAYAILEVKYGGACPTGRRPRGRSTRSAANTTEVNTNG